MFQEKWRQSAQAKNTPNFLRSLWFAILVQQLDIAISQNHLENAKNYLMRLEQQFPEESEVENCQAKFRSKSSENVLSNGWTVLS